MASEKTTAILEEIKALTILELSDLVKEIEEEFGESAAPVAVAAVGGAAPAAADEEKKEFRLAGEITSGVTDPDKVGLYSCFSLAADGTCQKLNKVTQYNSETNLQVQSIGYSSTSKEMSHGNVNDSTIKSYLENWYEKNLVTVDSKLSKEATYCNDRSISTYGDSAYQNQGYGLIPTMYSYPRFYSWNGSIIGLPRLTCENRNDRFSVSSTIGNGKMKYPVGMITADEVNMAGGRTDYVNNLYYLYSGVGGYWTLTVSKFSVWGTKGSNYYVAESGILHEASVGPDTNWVRVRPVINLDSSKVTFTGSGTRFDPYVIS